MKQPGEDILILCAIVLNKTLPVLTDCPSVLHSVTADSVLCPLHFKGTESDLVMTVGRLSPELRVLVPIQTRL